ncbi:serine hydrolase domain-containing protein [Candidatus Spongiisocius sp.]|uniref:serine hydrolase domain-containing protein n=1 Tax=Candidatus Spongiisocius sp. TaxID=3101273 RepID=UPI003B5CD446
MTDISGHVAAGFEPVFDAFEENFAVRGEVGAEFCAYVGGECVVNIWAGMATPDRPWADDTLVFLFSVTKGPTALVAQILADRGLMDVDAPIATYWPEFAAQGKDRALVRHILSHTLGLPSFPGYWDLVSADDAAGWHRNDEIAARLAAAPLAWEPGTNFGYHSMSYGWLVGELVRRIDGRTLGTFFADEVARPLGLDLWIGLPVEQHGRVARLLRDPDPAAELLKALWAPDNPAGAALFVGPERRSPVDLANDPDLWTAEAPAINGVGDARSVARMYAMLAGGGVLDGVRIVSEESVAAHTAEQARGIDAIFGGTSRVALGYGRSVRGGLSLGPNDEAFGMQGIGGAIGYADPVAEVGFGYAMNQTFMDAGTDRRPRALTTALYEALTRQGG